MAFNPRDTTVLKEELVGAIIDDRWLITGAIAQGGFGLVFRCEDAEDELPTDLALKLCSLEEIQSVDELVHAAKLTHDNLMPCLEWGDWTYRSPTREKIYHLYYIVMPRAKQSLRDYLETQGTLSDIEVLGVLKNVATALAYLHRKSPVPLVHRDLKPENIMQMPDGRWVLADFGIMRKGSHRATQYATNAFTDGYEPPEASQTSERVKIKPSWDLYQLGLIAFETVTGDPWSFEDGDFPEASRELAGHHQVLRQVCAGCLKREPNDRLSADDVIELVENALRTPRKNLTSLPEIKILYVKRNLYSLSSHGWQPRVKNTAMREALATGLSVYEAANDCVRVMQYTKVTDEFCLWQLCSGQAAAIEARLRNGKGVLEIDPDADLLVDGILPIADIHSRPELARIWLR